MTASIGVQILACVMTTVLRVVWHVYGWIRSVQDRAEQERLEQEEDDERYFQSYVNRAEMLRQGCLRESIANDPLSEPSMDNRLYQYRGVWSALDLDEQRRLAWESITLARVRLIHKAFEIGAKDND